MARVERIEQRPGFGSTHFAQDDPVRSPAESRLQKVVKRDVGFECVGLAFNRQNVRLLDVKLGGVLDDDDAILFGNEVSQYPQERGLAGPGSTADKQSLSAANLLCQQIRKRARQGAAIYKVIDGVMPTGDLPDGYGRVRADQPEEARRQARAPIAPARARAS